MIALAAFLAEDVGANPYLRLWRVGALRIGWRGADHRHERA